MAELRSRVDEIPLHKHMGFYQLEELLARAEVKTTFWGNREVTLKGYEGSVSLDAIAKKVLETSGKDFVRGAFLLNWDRVAGVNLVRKLKNLYLLSDEQLEASHAVTKLLHAVRTFFVQLYTQEAYDTTRSGIEETAENNFLGPNKQQFLKQHKAQLKFV